MTNLVMARNRGVKIMQKNGPERERALPESDADSAAGQLASFNTRES